jgi:membrane protein
VAYLRWPVMFVLIIFALSILPLWAEPAAGEVALDQLRRRVCCTRLARGVRLVLLVLSNFANYNATYGALGAVVGLMMWMWLSTIVVLVGAELNSEVEHQTARDSTVGRGAAQRRRWEQFRRSNTP